MSEIAESGFLSDQVLAEGGPNGLTRAIQRLCLHSGFEEAWNIDGPGDRGADVIGRRGDAKWVFQSKWKSSGLVGPSAVDEVADARKEYGASHSAVVTNTSFTQSAIDRASHYERSGLPIRMIDNSELKVLFSSDDFSTYLSSPTLRPYQQEASIALERSLSRYQRALLVMATGLGKTVVCGRIIADALEKERVKQVLVIAHLDTLVRQLEQALWWHIPKQVPTYLLTGSSKPDFLDGVACATVQTAVTYIEKGFRPDLLVVDEAHHLGEDNTLRKIVDTLDEIPQLGATATPWRGDKHDMTAHFNGPSFEMGIAQGMMLGYLSAVNYRLFTAVLDWTKVESLSRNSYTVKDLNHRLFLPQMDERVRDELIGAWERKPSPRAIVFCRTIEHAKRMARMLDGVPQFKGATCIHSGMTMRERQREILAFREGEVPLITAVDILNEGVDIPDVNIVCFVRVTHSRRIFVQQLGRGLRISENKESVEVLDFVSDIRRIAAVVELESDLKKHAPIKQRGDVEDVLLPATHRISFEDQEVGEFMREWLQDVADVESAKDEELLQFPPVPST